MHLKHILRLVGYCPHVPLIQHFEGSLESEVSVDILVRMLPRVSVDWAA